MSAWYPPPLAEDRPTYIALANAIRDAVTAGTLAAGARLPTIRDLAAHLRVAAATVTRAYAEAERRGLTTGTVGRGSFVRAARAIESAWRAPFATREFVVPGIYDLQSRVLPNPHEWETAGGGRALLPSPRHQAELLEALYTLARSTEPWTVREAGVQWAAHCGVDIAPEQVLLAAGGQHAVAAALCAVRTGDAPIAVPALTNSGVLTAALHLRVPLVAVRTDAQGFDPRHLERVCRSAHPCAIYCAPAVGNPIPQAMTADRRMALARIAERHKIWVIDDDAGGLLVKRSGPALTTLLPAHTLWLGSVSQSLGMGFRVAFVGAPPGLASPMQEALRALAWVVATPGAQLTARWLADGTIVRVIRARRAAIAERLRIVTRVLGRQRHVMMPGVPYVWLDAPPGWRAGRLHAALLSAGVSVAPGAQFIAGALRPRQGVRISVGAMLSTAQYTDALRRIADVCAHPARYRATAT